MPTAAPGRNLTLVGLMGVGKTTVGAILARMLARPLVDVDALIELRAGMAVAEFFSRHGEDRFRALESTIIAEVVTTPAQIISTGGGAVLDPVNVAELRRAGEVVWLDAPVVTLVRNLSGDLEVERRPLLADGKMIDRLTGLRDARQDAYMRAASVVVQADSKSPDDIAREIIDWALVQPHLLTDKDVL